MKTIIYKSDSEGVTAIGNTSPLPVTFTRDDDAFTARANTNNATTPVLIRSGSSGQTIYATDIVLSSENAGDVWLEDSDGTELTPKFYVAANSNLVLNLSTPLAVTAGKGLYMQSTSAINLSAFVTGYQI